MSLACARYLPLLGVAAACLSPSLPARAWGDEGHEIVAVIAYARLPPAAKAGADALLHADKDPLTAPDFISRATWADRYRDSDRDTTKVHYLATHKWHFVDIEIDGGSVDAACNHHPPLPHATPASQGPAADCVVDKVDQFAAELKKHGTPKAEKLLALKFLLHFVGDMHQPLHSADHHDSGGNAVPVLYGSITSPVNLHSYWDGHLVQELGHDPRAAGATLNGAITSAQAGAWSAGSTASWAEETFAQAKAVAYDFAGATPFTDSNGVTGEKLDATYDERALPLVREQLSKAGVRLAVVINGALK